MGSKTIQMTLRSNQMVIFILLTLEKRIRKLEKDVKKIAKDSSISTDNQMDALLSIFDKEVY